MRTDRPEMSEADNGLDDPRPGSAQDAQDRLTDLPRGHPSSPYNEDGSRKPPVVRLKDLELPEPDERGLQSSDRPRPLTDAEHTEHVREVRTGLDSARRNGLTTYQQFTTDKDQEQWTPERDRIQGDLVDEIYARAGDVPCDFQAVIAGGLPGAGKSTILDKHAGIDQSKYLTINPDNIKEEMASQGLIPPVDGLSPMEASDLVHVESSHIAKQLAMRAQADGKNIIWDVTMRSQSSTEQRIISLRSAGYTHVEGIFVEIPVEISVSRADARHREGHDDYLAGRGLGGRFVPAEVITRQADAEWGSLNRKAFEAVKHRLDIWSIYDNSADGSGPVLMDAGQQEERTS